MSDSFFCFVVSGVFFVFSVHCLSQTSEWHRTFTACNDRLFVRINRVVGWSFVAVTAFASALWFSLGVLT